MITESLKSWRTAKFPFWGLATLLMLIFIMGGSARYDAQSLAILRPLAVAMCGVALLTLSKDHLVKHKFLAIWALAVVIIVSLYLLKLPAFLAHYFPSQGLPTLIMASADTVNGQIWITATPSATLNSFFSLFIPLSVLLFGFQLDPEERGLLLPLILGLGLMSCIWGIFQAVGDPQGPLYLYRITNYGSAVGFFANRNHQAVLLAILFPALATYAAIFLKKTVNARLLKSLLLGVACILVLLIVIVGSRAGVVLGALGILIAFFFAKAPKLVLRDRKKPVIFNYNYLLAIFFMLLTAAAAVIMSRAQAIERLSSPDHTEELRWKVWSPIIDMALGYLPFGSGSGSFSAIYHVYEARTLLRAYYVNQAHNDWIDLFLTMGILGVLLLVAIGGGSLWKAGIAFARTQGAVRKQVYLARLGAAIIAILALASIADYPLRTPIGASLFVIGLLWLWNVGKRSPKRTGSS